jgi:hypothetical protein
MLETELKNQCDEARKKMDKFTKLNRKKTWQMALDKADKVLNAYCRIKFDKKEFTQHPLGRVDESECGKKVTLYVNRTKIYDGTVSYIERWWAARNLYRDLCYSIEQNLATD